jgi:hypothetical protein
MNPNWTDANIREFPFGAHRVSLKLDVSLEELGLGAPDMVPVEVM